jgi:MFS family permease
MSAGRNQPMQHADNDTTQPSPLRHWMALAVLLSNAVLVMAPSLPYFGARLIGDVTRHPLDSSTVYFLVAEALTRWPPSMSSMFYWHPHGWDITHNFPDIGNAVLYTPVTRVFGALYAHNLAMLVMLFLAGAAAYALGVLLLRDRLAALLGGLLFANMDPLFFAIRWGEDDVASLWLLPAWLAWLLWCFRRLEPDLAAGLGRRGLTFGAVAGAALALTGWLNSYYLLFCLLIAPLAWAAAAWGTRPRLAARGWGAFALALALCFALLYGPRAAVGTPPWVPRVWEASAAESLQDLTQPDVLPRHGAHLDMRGLLDPTTDKQRARNTEGVLYLGILPLTLALLGLGRLPRRPRLLLLSLGAVGLLLALGTHLRWGDDSLMVGGHLIPGPLSLLNIVLPPLRAVKHPYRFVSLLFLAVGLLAAVGALGLARRAAPRRPGPLAALLVGLCVAERVLLGMGGAPMEATAIPVPAGLAQLPRIEGQPALVVLPVDWAQEPHDLEYTSYHRFLMMIHRRPLHIPREALWLQQPLDRGEMRCALLELARDGVGVIVLFDALPDYASRVNERDDPWEVGRLYELFGGEALGPARGNLQGVSTPWYRDQELEIHRVPSPRDLEAVVGDGCQPSPRSQRARPSWR